MWDRVLLAAEDERRAWFDGYTALDRDRPRERDTRDAPAGTTLPAYRCRAPGCPVHVVALLLLAASDGKVMTSAASTAQHTTEIRIFI